MSFEATYKKINFGCLSDAYTPSYYFGAYTQSYIMPQLFDFYNTGWNYGFSSYSPYSYGYSHYAPTLSFAPSKTSYAPSTSFAPSSSSYAPSSSYSSKSFGSLLTSKPSAPAARNYSYKAVASATKQKLGPEFLAKVKKVAQNINCDYKDLLAVMNSESGLNPAIQNQAGYQAYGLIQFTPAAAREIGTTVEKLVKMSAVEQLDYVEKFYLNARKTRGFGNKKFTAADLYAITFLPARANRDVLCVKGERWESGPKKGQLKNWYEANTVFDKNGNNKIEKWELQEQMDACRVDEKIFAVA